MDDNETVQLSSSFERRVNFKRLLKSFGRSDSKGIQRLNQLCNSQERHSGIHDDDTTISQDEHRQSSQTSVGSNSSAETVSCPLDIPPASHDHQSIQQSPPLPRTQARVGRSQRSKHSSSSRSSPSFSVAPVSSTAGPSPRFKSAGSRPSSFSSRSKSPLSMEASSPSTCTRSPRSAAPQLKQAPESPTKTRFFGRSSWSSSPRHSVSPESSSPPDTSRQTVALLAKDAPAHGSTGRDGGSLNKPKRGKTRKKRSLSGGNASHSKLSMLRTKSDNACSVVMPSSGSTSPEYSDDEKNVLTSPRTASLRKRVSLRLSGSFGNLTQSFLKPPRSSSQNAIKSPEKLNINTEEVRWNRVLKIDPQLHWVDQDETSFTFLNKLGAGSYGEVHKARHIKTGLEIAVKQVRKQSSKDMEDALKKEIAILKKCRHPNLVSYFGSLTTKDGCIWIMMEYCEKGSVAQLMKSKPAKCLPEEEVGSILYKTLLGLTYLHSHSIIHRDLKAANILITNDGDIKISDFGVSAQLGDTLEEGSDSSIGTVLFMAPELIAQQDYDERADIWSLGITAIEIATGSPPYVNVHIARAMYLLTTDPPEKLYEGYTFSDGLRFFIARCLVKDRKTRPSAGTLLLDPYIVAAEEAFLHEEVLRDQLSMACVGKEKCDRRKSKRLPKTSEFPAHLLDVALKEERERGKRYEKELRVLRMSLQDSERKLHVAERKLGDMKTQYEKLCSTFQDYRNLHAHCDVTLPPSLKTALDTVLTNSAFREAT